MSELSQYVHMKYCIVAYGYGPSSLDSSLDAPVRASGKCQIASKSN